jgi:uncharacterized protein involved in response to NO
MLNIENRPIPPSIALFELGFRPFFAAAGLFAVIAMALWMAAYAFAMPLPATALAPMHWHAHEMIFGYAMAVVAGFLLTAVVNWTGNMSLRHWPLAGLLLAWLVARMVLLSPLEHGLTVAAITDTLFVFGLIIGVSIPVWRARQWKQAGILSKLWLMLFANLAFYAGALGYLDEGLRWGLYSGLYLVVALVFVMGRRVIPFFIERGVDEEVTLRSRGWIDIASLVLFTLWLLLDVFTQQRQAVAWLSVVLLAVHLIRLWDWHTPGIWRKPLLWSLYLGYGFLVLGFALKAAAFWIGFADALTVHAFAYGSIGLVTVGMMSRVALGHSGRNVFDPPAVLAVIFALVLVGALVRVVMPIFAPAHYVLWIGISQVFWILGFGGFSMLYLPILFRPRIDGRPG